MTIGVDVQRDIVAVSVWVGGTKRESFNLSHADSQRICQLVRENVKTDEIDCPIGGMAIPGDWNIQQFIRGAVELNKI